MSSERRMSINGRRVSTLIPPIELKLHSDDEYQQSQGAESTDAEENPNSNKAAYAIIFAVFAHGINFSSVVPNYPAMCMPGMQTDSFPSIEPWMGLASAQYFLFGSTSIGGVLSGFLFGWLSGRIGYRKVFMMLAFGEVVFTIGRYLTRGSYWGFAVVSFINSLFGGTVAVGNGYMCHLFTDRVKIDSYIGYLLATTLLSVSLGGLLTVITPFSLFLPLIPAAAISFVAFVLLFFFVEDLTLSTVDSDANEEAADTGAPQKLDRRTFVTIVLGAFIDNIGSLGIFPLAFSPVMYMKYFADFELEGRTPVMSENEYRWLYSMIALTVVPSVLICPLLYKKLGIALTCVTTNVFTGCIILGLIFAASKPPTKQNYAIFASIVYIGLPLAVISNLSTSPMLDRIAPKEMKAFAQSLNSAIYNLANAFFPIVLGIISDMRGYMLMLYILVGAQALASLVNLPLVFHPLLGRESNNKAKMADLAKDEDLETNAHTDKRPVNGTMEDTGVTSNQ